MPFSPDEYVTDPVLKVLIDADALLSDESKWCKNDFHREDRFCLLGAIGCQSYSQVGPPMDTAMLLAGLLPNENRGQKLDRVWAFNDKRETTFADIKALFAKAIAAQRATGEAVYPGVGS